MSRAIFFAANFSGPYAKLREGLFVAEEDVGSLPGRLSRRSNPVNVAEAHLAVQVHAAVELGQHVHGGGIRAERDVEQARW